MNKTCARCQKVVYPIEELKCLDKTWHKTCFRCTECGMTLNMKTYKGFNKLPYCEAHIPKAKATAIADTPELKRIAENTKIQSNVKYHADFEKAKGKFTQVADDPETLRIKQNTKHISNVAYHGDLEKKAAMERQREAAEVADSRGATTSPTSLSSQNLHHNNQQHQQQNLSSYQGNVPTSVTTSSQQLQQTTTNNYNQLRSAILQNSHHPTGAAINDGSVGPISPSSVASSPYAAYDQYDNYARPAATYNNNISSNNINNNHAIYQQQQQLQQKPYQQQQQQQQQNQPTAAQQLYASNTFGSQHQSGTSLAAGSTASTTSSNTTASHHSNGSGGGSGVIHNGSGNGGANISANNIGKIADYDPLTDGPRQMPNTSRPTTTLVYSSESRGSVNSTYPKRVGSIADIDPANGIYGSIAADNLSTHSINHQQQQQQQYYQQMQLMQQQQQQQQALQVQQHEQQLRQTQSKPNLRVYRALYDYVAQDVDEVSFREGDVIFEVDSIDSGWMTGKVERTGKTGMLPANYVEQAVI